MARSELNVPLQILLDHFLINLELSFLALSLHCERSAGRQCCRSYWFSETNGMLFFPAVEQTGSNRSGLVVPVPWKPAGRVQAVHRATDTEIVVRAEGCTLLHPSPPLVLCSREAQQQSIPPAPAQTVLLSVGIPLARGPAGALRLCKDFYFIPGLDPCH